MNAANSPSMVTYPIETARLNRNSASTGADSACEACGSVVDMTKSLLIRKNRIVGCPRCEWGRATPRVTDRLMSVLPLIAHAVG